MSLYCGDNHQFVEDDLLGNFHNNPQTIIIWPKFKMDSHVRLYSNSYHSFDFIPVQF